jgi:hypothetical protein
MSAPTPAPAVQTCYQPVHKLTGERGPALPYAINAALWIIERRDSSAWRWEAVPVAVPPRVIQSRP